MINPTSVMLVQALSQSEGGGGGGSQAIVSLFSLLGIIGMWKVFTKAGRPGWAAIVPIYNLFMLLQIVGRPTWWLILMFVPLVNLVVAIILMSDLAKAFGQGMGFTIGLILLNGIFMMILGYGDAQYGGSSAPMAPGAV